MGLGTVFLYKAIPSISLINMDHHNETQSVIVPFTRRGMRSINQNESPLPEPPTPGNSNQVFCN